MSRSWSRPGRLSMGFAIVLAAVAQAAGPARAEAPVLWVADDHADTIYEVTLDGQLLSQFPTLVGARLKEASGIDLDPWDDTLWVVNETGRVVHYTKAGEQLGFFRTQELFGGDQLEGIAVDFFDGSLWISEDQVIPEDPALPIQPATIYNVTVDGALIHSFPTSSFDPQSTSPQGIAADPFDGSLWVTDNRAAAIYHITRHGGLIGSFPVSAFGAPPPDDNPQGISVDQWNGSLWITDRWASTVYNVSTAGELLSSFTSASYDVLSEDPVGVAHDPRTVQRATRNLIADLGDLLGSLPAGVSGDDEKDADKIRDAIEELEKSLEPKLWQDPSTPRPDGEGAKVLDKGKKAVEKLSEVRNPHGNTDVSWAIDALLAQGRGLALSAMERATGEMHEVCAANPRGNPCQEARKKLQEAQEDLAKARDELAKGHPHHAMAAYKDAFKHAGEAIEKANPDNEKPEAAEAKLRVPAGEPVFLTLRGKDRDGDAPLFFVLEKAPEHGTLRLNPLSGVALYTPDPGFGGDDAFEFRVADGIEVSDKAKVKLEVGR